MRLILLLIVLSAKLLSAQPQQHITLHFDQEGTTSIGGNWKYMGGDVKDAYLKHFNDSLWQVSDSLKAPVLKDTIVWYRKHVHIDSAFVNQPYTLKLIWGRKSDVYIDGKHVHTLDPKRSILWNYVVPSVFILDNTKDHVIAIRTVTTKKANPAILNMEETPTPVVVILPYKNEIRRDVILMTVVTGFMTFMVSCFLVLAFFHLILFIFYHEERSNLFLGLFCLVFGSFFLVVMGMFITGEGSFFHDAFRAVRFLLPFLPVFLLGLFDNVFYKRLRKFFWICIAAMVLSTLLDHFHIINSFAGLVGFAAFVEMTRVIIVGIRKKKPGSRIIGLGLLTTIIGFPLLIWSGFALSDNGLFGSDVLIVCFILAALALLLLSIPGTMSFHFASNFSRTNKELSMQIEQVKQLSETTIRQEQEKKKILEEQKHLLELQVEERTKEVVFQKKLLEQKNKDVTDSITYARKIQYAILHNESEFTELFEDSFILFIPKDIVSGDFYWFEKKNGFNYVVAADCTGHGVPGAFMSMIGTTILNDIITDNEEVQPAEALNELNQRVREILKQDENAESRDGMDITFGKFDPATRQLQLASGLRPVYIIRNGELFDIKADKFSIGGFLSNDKAFTNNVMQLEKDDAVYFFSDGYADQFGGERGKKFMLKNFQRFLLQISTLPLSEQKQKLSDLHYQWKRDLEQVDDILVIGFRVK